MTKESMMDRVVAERVVSILLRASQEIASTIDIVRTSESAEQAKQYSHAVGEVMYALDSVLRPIWIEYPDLHP